MSPQYRVASIEGTYYYTKGVISLYIYSPIPDTFLTATQIDTATAFAATTHDIKDIVRIFVNFQNIMQKSASVYSESSDLCQR